MMFYESRVTKSSTTSNEMQIAALKIGACRTIEQVMKFANAILLVARQDCPALLSLDAPTSIQSAADIDCWISALQKAAGSETADPITFGSVYATLRAALRRVQAIEESTTQG
jgi:hypothetical protein